MKLVETKSFRKQFLSIKRRGGEADVVYMQACGAIDNWDRGQESALPRTHHGESRIKHVVKYDLRGYYRLVTTEHAGVRALVWIGTHKEVDEWLKNNKGRDFVITDSGEVEFIPIHTGPSEPPEHADPTQVRLSRRSGRVLDSLPDGFINDLLLSAKLLRAFGRITHESFEEDEDDVWAFIADQQYDFPEQQGAIFDTFYLLRDGNVAGACARVKLFAQKATASTETPEAFVEAIDEGTASATICNLNDLSDAEREHRFKNSSYADWLLYLHPKQNKYVDAEYGGPARLLGVSGSGKTCVLVHRANELAKRYPGERILILVLNESLQNLLDNLVDKLCAPTQRSQIKVNRIYRYFYEAVRRVAPSAMIENYDRFSREGLEECWRDFTGKIHAQRIAAPLLPLLRLHDVDSWAYLHDELIWVRTGFGIKEENRKDYLTCERFGRGIHFPRLSHEQSDYKGAKTKTGFPADTRPRVLDLLKEYEEYMKVGGLLDEDGVALLAFENRNQIADTPELRARCVLIDEVQDCSTTQLAVVSKLPTQQKDGLFLVGDPVQKVFPRQQHLPSAGIDIRGRGSLLTINYRNTRQVLEAAYQIIASFRGKSPVPDDEILCPEYALRNGPRPKLVQCESREEQFRIVGEMISLLQHDADSTTCISTPCVNSGATSNRSATRNSSRIDQELLSLCNKNKWSIRSLSEPMALTDLTTNVLTATFQELKGFEFKNMFLLDLSDRHLMARAIPTDEVWRIAFQLYVAMTRAQDELWLFSVGPPSQLLTPLLDFVDRISASQFD
jgi:superfamily I DNA/RNA helicase